MKFGSFMENNNINTHITNMLINFIQSIYLMKYENIILREY